VTAIGSVLHAVAAGVLTPDEAATLSTVLEAKRRAIEIVNLHLGGATTEVRSYIDTLESRATVLRIAGDDGKYVIDVSRRS
jgi:hypothetical protein